jgi:hypothetical protein
MNSIALRFPATRPVLRSAESLRFERLRDDICGKKPFLPLRALLSDRFAEFLPSVSVIEPSIAEMKLPIRMTGERIADASPIDMPDNDYLNLVREDMRPYAYRTGIEMIDRPCGLWERLTAGLNDNSSHGFEITGFPVIDEERKVRQLAFFVRFAPVLDETARQLTAVAEGVEGEWIDLGSGVPKVSPVGFL